MKRKCIICGAEFDGRPDKLMCSFACKQERARQRSKEWNDAHREEQNEKLRQQRKEKRNRHKEIPYKLQATRNDCKWIKDYVNGDRLTRIAMLAEALTDYRIELMSYGKLSTYWQTDTYRMWESKVIRIKRRASHDKFHTENQNTT